MIKSHIEQHLRHNASGTVSVVKEHDDRRQPQIKERRCGWCDTVIGTKHGEAPDDHADGICKNCLTEQLKEVGLDKRLVDRVYHYGLAKSGIRHPLLMVKSARPLQGNIDFNGLQISVENRRGNIRQWYDPAAASHGMTRMVVPYGYIRGTLGVDGDQYDVFVGPHRDAPFVYVVRQMKAPEFTAFDEEKALVGFRTQEEAVALYRRHYDDPRFFGSVRRIPFAEFRDQVMKTRQNGGRLEKAHAILSKFLTPKEQEAFDLRQRVSRPGDSFNLGQFMQGMRVELEHSDVTGGDALLTAKIVAAHLREREDYYTALAKMEKACAGVYLLRSRRSG